MKRVTFFVFIALVSCLASGQNIYVVNSTPGTVADFANLQSAVDASKDGDIIHVQPSEESYSAIVSKRLNIYGRSHSKKGYITKATFEIISEGSGSKIEGFDAAISFSGSGLISDIDVKNCKLMNFWMRERGEGYSYNRINLIGNVIIPNFESFNSVLAKNELVIWVDVESKDINITNNLIYSAISIWGDSREVKLKNNIFFGDFFSVRGGTNTLEINDCLFIANVEGGKELSVYSDDGGDIVMNNCYSFNYSSSNSFTFPNNDNVKLINSKENVNPMFVKVNTKENSIASPLGDFNPDEDDLHLQPNSQVNDAGVYGK